MIPLSKPRSATIALIMLGVVASQQAFRLEAQASAPQAVALPSGVSPVSELAVGGRQLVLDSNGTLYRSDEQGKHWRPVKQQWEGKAIELLGIPALTPGSSKDVYVAVLLKSTSALHWVSVDGGKTWSPSTLDDVRRDDVHWSGE
jgi:photosystem II stability/assembly factor-like uncharacterized protein